jgi:hypothetical protein
VVLRINSLGEQPPASLTQPKDAHEARDNEANPQQTEQNIKRDRVCRCHQIFDLVSKYAVPANLSLIATKTHQNFIQRSGGLLARKPIAN